MLGTICRERGWLGLPAAIHKMTGRPAQRFGLHDRGLLRPEYFADVTVFDPGQVNSPANYESPELAPVGIRYVFRNGKLEVGGDSGI